MYLLTYWPGGTVQHVANLPKLKPAQSYIPPYPYPLIWKRSLQAPWTEYMWEGVGGRDDTVSKSLATATKAPPKTPPSAREEHDPEWNLIMGSVLDTLMHDYPRFFTHPLQTHIYHNEIELRDEHDLKIKGLPMYLSLIHTMRLFCSLVGWLPEVTARYNVQMDTHQIRVRWNVKINPNNPMPLFMDGVSIYKVGRDGLVYEHMLQFVTMSFNPGVRVPAIPAWDPVVARYPRLGLEVGGLQQWAHEIAKEHSSHPPVFQPAPASRLEDEPHGAEDWAVSGSSGVVRHHVTSPLVALAHFFSKWLPV
eukprot:EG_transcript_7128